MMMSCMGRSRTFLFKQRLTRQQREVMFDFMNSNVARWQSPKEKMADYLRQLEIIRQIRETITAKDELNLPQICVIGDQSSGKSSFLSRLTGVSFPTAAKMCTKAATVVTCNRDGTLSLPHYEIEDCDKPGTYKVVKCTATAIQETQDKLLRANGAKSDDDNLIITDKSIKLRVTGPHVIDIIIVDLPGIQHAGPTKNAITALIEENIKKPETLNLIISEAKQDAELTKAIELAEKYDPDHERTIRVLSKFDNFDTRETKKRAVDLVKSDARSGSFGPHAVISIGRDGKLRSNQDGHNKEKKQLMEEYSIPESRAGIGCLEARLQPLFASLVKKNLPFLKEKATSLLFETNAHLDKVGKEPLSPMDMVFKCHSCLLGAVKALDTDLTERSFVPFKQGIFDVDAKITFDFATSGFKLNAFECILFQGKEPFDDAAMCIREIWEPIVHDYIKSAKGVALESMNVLKENSATKIYAPMISVIRVEYQEYLQNEVLPRFHDACIQALNEERFFGTANNYFDAKYFGEEICPPAFLNRCRQKLQAVLQDNAKSPVHSPNYPYHRNVNVAHLIVAIEEAKGELVAELNHTTLMENQKQRVFAAVKAHFDVEKKTFVDNLLKKTKDILIKGHKEWIERDLLRSQDIIAAAKEDESVVKLREDLRDKVKRLENCMLLLRDVPLPVKGSIVE